MNSQRSDHKPSENKLLILSINIEINSTKIDPGREVLYPWTTWEI